MSREPLAHGALSDQMRALAAGGDGPLAELWQARVQRHFDDSYAGLPLHKFPEDLRTYEHVLWERAPRVVIEVGVENGASTLWLRDRLFGFQHYRAGPAPLVVAVDVNIEPAQSNLATLPEEGVAGIELIEGDITKDAVVERILTSVPEEAEVFVIEDAQHDGPTTLAALQALAPLIREGGYYMVEDTCVDYEPLRVYEDWPRGCATALADWLATDPLGRRFERAPQHQSYGLTCHPGGLLRRLQDR